MKTIITHSSGETQHLAHEIVSSLNGKNVLALYGDLGSGKTTFSQGIGKALGITNRMVSPTFIVVRSYKLPLLPLLRSGVSGQEVISDELPSALRSTPFANLYHIDLYRIEKPEEVIDLGILDFARDPKNLVVIEWAEKMGKYLPEKRVDVKFEYVGEKERKIIIS